MKSFPHFIGVVGFVLAASCAGNSLLAPRPSALARVAPDIFDVRVESSRGPFVVRAHRDWSPQGVDRFYYLVRSRYYDDDRFFRVVGGFVAQWGLSGDPKINAVWNNRSIGDDSVRTSNRRGRV